MARSLILLFICLALFGCTDLGVEPKPPLAMHGDDIAVGVVPGVVGVFFTDSTSLQQAEQFVKDLGLTFKFAPTGTPLNGVVSVPVGSEDGWVVKLKTYPIVKTADRIVVTWTS